MDRCSFEGNTCRIKESNPRPIKYRYDSIECWGKPNRIRAAFIESAKSSSVSSNVPSKSNIIDDIIYYDFLPKISIKSCYEKV